MLFSEIGIEYFGFYSILRLEGEWHPPQALNSGVSVPELDPNLKQPFSN